jgi:hypothetical protein
MMRFIPTRIHGWIDYLMGALLIVSPWLFGFADDGIETWLPVLLGGGVILYSLFTAYELGAVRAISMPVHLGLDIAGGLLLAISPWLFGFAQITWLPHLVLGLVGVGTALMTQLYPVGLPAVEREPTLPRGTRHA